MATFNFVPTWGKIWLFVSTLICLYDAFFILLRPRTLPGGDLHAYWNPYALYIEIDTLYGDLKDEFVFHQSILNLYECALNIITLILLSSKGAKSQLSGTFLAIAVNAFTFWKTVLYFQYGIPHSQIKNVVEYIFLFIVPSGFWVVVPLANMISISKRISSSILSNPAINSEKVKQKQS